MRAGLRSILLKRSARVLPVKGAYNNTALDVLTDLNPFVRNDNGVGSALSVKVGPHQIVRNPNGSGWRGYFEGIADTGSPAITGPMLATASQIGGTWTFSPITLLVTPNSSPNWENNELSPSSVYWDEQNNRWVIWYHGGHNPPGGTRQIGVMYSTDGVTGRTFVRDPGNPILRIGAGGSSDDAHVSDLKIIRLPDLSYLGFYTGRQSGGPSNGTIHKVTGTAPNLLTKRGEVIQEGAAASWNETGMYPSQPWRDALTGRLHMFCGNGDTGDGALGAFYSDDLGATWTPQAGNPLAQGTGSGTSFDSHIGDVAQTVLDGDVIIVTTGGEAASYPTNAPLRGQIAYMSPLANSSASRPGKYYGAGGYTEVTGDSPLSVNQFTVCGRFRAKRTSRNNHRTIFAERFDNNRFSYSRIDGGGGANSGKLTIFFRASVSDLFTLRSLSTVDDDVWHEWALVRSAADAFELFLDGISQATYTNSITTDANATTKAVGNWHQTLGVANEPSHFTISDHVVILGSALTWTQIQAILNSRTFPEGVSAEIDFPTAGTDTGAVTTVEATG